MFGKLIKEKHKYFFILSLFVITFVIIFFKLKRIEPFYSLSLRTSDLYFRFNARNINKNVVLVVVDEKSVNYFGRWPWDRRVLAKGLAKLKKARVVVLDMVFSENTSRQADLSLANTISSLGNVVCGFFVRLVSTQKISPEIVDIMSDSALLRVPEILPFPTAKYIEPNIYPVTESCLLVGTFNAYADKDNIFRHYPVGFVYQGDFYPSIGIQALRVFLKKEAWISDKGELYIGKKRVFIDDTHMIPLNFYKFEKYRKHMISFVDLYKGKISPEVFKNKIVIVGISEAGVTDIRATPIGQIPGPLLHLTFISNFLNNEILASSRILDVMFIFFSLIWILLNYKFIETSYYRIFSYAGFAFFNIFTGIFLYRFYCVKLDLFFPVFNLAILGLLIETYTSLVKSQQARFLKSAFGTYLSEKLLDVIIKDPSRLKLGGEKKEVTVLFSDIRGFTSLSEKLKPEVLVELLNHYLTPMTEIILKNEGTLDKYIGDAIMALWNAPLDVEDHPKKALYTGYQMLIKLEEINQFFIKKYGFRLNIGIGINTGDVVVGNMGSEKRFDYTAIGDTVNLASRLEGLNKIYQTNLLFSEFTYEKVNFNELPFIAVDVDFVRVKGKEQPVRIFTILEKSEESEKTKEIYESALKDYREGNFAEAMEKFNLIKSFPPACIMLKRCEELLKAPPEKWDGVFTAKTK